ncbi:LacI family DNA-binding transcriptional regulator [Xylanimonas ulmi]|uniref:LacI family transcriptional regulator n=1 Tax=Xylanimonas ulmi TaxID=228973 RepID=A0A4Q7M374_9MICO|nr:LacI family DNA-binding transcriptional regulator [Xylanibacterium ulmi]RZS61964.1 LacI family transcriptional regulator [Xylanibacterium ulmi]
MARVRLVDVAARVGVSAKTVSNVVHGTGMVSDAVRAKVLAAIDDLGYRPNLAARQLRSGTSGLVGLAIPDLREPYFAEFASGFFTAAQRRGLTVLVSQTHGDRVAERRISQGAGLPAVDGLVLSPLALTTQDLGERTSSIPLVLIGEHGEALATERVPHVGIDNVAAARAATEHLLDLGRSRVAVIGAQDHGSTATSRLRLAGYRAALEAAGVPFDPALVGAVTDFNRAEGSAAAERLLTSGTEFDGLFCFSDTLAFGALYTLATHGVAIPEHVSVIGFDDIGEGRYSMPPFASVNVNSEGTAEHILDIFADGAPSHSRLVEVAFTVLSAEARASRH